MLIIRSSLGAVRAVLLFFAVATVDGCGLISFDTTVNIAPQVVPGNPAAAALPQSTVTTVEFPLDAKSLPSDADLAQSVKLSTLTLKVTAPAEATFDFLQALSVTIVGPPSGGLPTRAIAAGSPAAGAREVILKPIGDVDLLPYVKANATVRATGTGRPPSVDTTVAGQAVLTVSL